MSDQRSPRSFPLVPIAVGMIIVLGLVAVLLSRGGDDDGSGVQTGSAATGSIRETRPVSSAGAALPPHGEGVDAAVGMPAPEMTGAAFDGAAVAISNDGTPKVLMFLAHWCPHCQKEVPVIAEWIEQNGPPEGVALVSIATATVAERPNYPPSAWLEREGWQPVVLADDEQGSAATAYGLTAFPFFVAVDAQGKVVERVSGELTVQQIEDLVARARGVG